MNTKVETLAGKTLEQADFSPYTQYVKGATQDNGVIKIQTVQMPTHLYSILRDYLVGFGFQRHPRDRYFFAPATPETEAVAVKLAGQVVTPAPVAVAETPDTPPATPPTAKPTAKAQTKPAPKPGATKRQRRTPDPDQSPYPDLNALSPDYSQTTPVTEVAQETAPAAE